MIECHIKDCQFHNKNDTCTETPFSIHGLDIELKSWFPVHLVKCYLVDEDRIIPPPRKEKLL